MVGFKNEEVADFFKKKEKEFKRYKVVLVAPHEETILPKRKTLAGCYYRLFFESSISSKAHEKGAVISYSKFILKIGAGSNPQTPKFVTELVLSKFIDRIFLGTGI